MLERIEIWLVVQNDCSTKYTKLLFQVTITSSGVSSSSLMTLMAMANDPDEVIPAVDTQNKSKTLEFEGRGTVPCHIW